MHGSYSERAAHDTPSICSTCNVNNCYTVCRELYACVQTNIVPEFAVMQQCTNVCDDWQKPKEAFHKITRSSHVHVCYRTSIMNLLCGLHSSEGNSDRGKSSNNQARTWNYTLVLIFNHASHRSRLRSFMPHCPNVPVTDVSLFSSHWA